MSWHDVRSGRKSPAPPPARCEGAARASTVRRGWRARGSVLLRVFAAEAVDAASRVEKLLLAGEERVASRAHVDAVAARSRVGFVGGPTGAGNGGLGVVGVRCCFHGCIS